MQKRVLLQKVIVTLLLRNTTDGLTNACDLALGRTKKKSNRVIEINTLQGILCGTDRKSLEVDYLSEKMGHTSEFGSWTCKQKETQRKNKKKQNKGRTMVPFRPSGRAHGTRVYGNHEVKLGKIINRNTPRKNEQRKCTKQQTHRQRRAGEPMLVTQDVLTDINVGVYLTSPSVWAWLIRASQPTASSWHLSVCGESMLHVKHGRVSPKAIPPKLTLHRSESSEA